MSRLGSSASLDAKSDFSHYQKVTLVMRSHDFRLLTPGLAAFRLGALH
jgi:hypothetical protein